MNASMRRLVKGAVFGGIVTAAISMILFAFDNFLLYPVSAIIAAGMSLMGIAMLRTFR